MSKKIVISAKEFKKLLKEIRKLTKQLNECSAANMFLNKQIKEYNKKFAKGSKDDISM